MHFSKNNLVSFRILHRNRTNMMATDVYIRKETSCKVLTHMIMESEMYHHLPSASRRPKRINGEVPLQGQEIDILS